MWSFDTFWCDERWWNDSTENFLLLLLSLSVRCWLTDFKTWTEVWCMKHTNDASGWDEERRQLNRETGGDNNNWRTGDAAPDPHINSMGERIRRCEEMRRADAATSARLSSCHTTLYQRRKTTRFRTLGRTSGLMLMFYGSKKSVRKVSVGHEIRNKLCALKLHHPHDHHVSNCFCTSGLYDHEMMRMMMMCASFKSCMWCIPKVIWIFSKKRKFSSASQLEF